jgi:glycosyltransferase involved in cell wall biosynthesis
MTFSVILPASNEAALIGHCLNALLASEWTRSESVEIVVVANGCTDDTADQARVLQTGLPNVGGGWLFWILPKVGN